MHITLYITQVCDKKDYDLLDQLMKGFDCHRNLVYKDIGGAEFNYQLSNNTFEYAGQYRDYQTEIVNVVKQYFPLKTATIMTGNGNLGIDNIPSYHHQE